MPDPPFPVVPALLLALIAKLGWRSTARDPSGATELGVLADGAAHKMLLVGMDRGPGTDAWFALDSAPPGFAPQTHLISRATYDVLRGGAACHDGAVAYQGKTYRLRVWHDGANLTAEAIAV